MRARARERGHAGTGTGEKTSVNVLAETWATRVRDTSGDMPSSSAPEPVDKDLAVREDIRLLGRLLGDTVRASDGDAVFDAIERVR